MWVGSNVDVKPNGVFNPVAFDPSGHPAIAYQGPPDSGSSDQLKYAAFDGAHWNKQTVGTGGGWCTLAFSPAGDPAISHVAWRSSTDTIVMSAALSAGTWHLEPIAYQAGTPSLAFTPAGEPAVSYHDRASATVKYAVFADRAWQHFLVDQTGKDQNGCGGAISR